MRGSTISPSTSAAAWSATSCSCASTARARVASLRGASLLKGKQHADTTLVADHKAQRLPEPRGVRLRARRRKPRRVPGQDHRAAACAEDRRQDDDAVAAAVRDAEADNKPELEIFADDVQCGHGATAGALDEDLKFYLMARGIPESRGRGAAGAGLHRRGDRRHRACRPARRADGAGRGLAPGAGRLSHVLRSIASRGQQRRL